MSAPALLASILASPDDDLPRLVYADWLDEHGDPARAEFIRTQIELAKLPDHDPRHRPLEDREHELLSEHERLWLPDTSGVREWEWRRGFVDDISADHEQLTTSGTGSWLSHPVTRVRAVRGDLMPLAHDQHWIGADWNRTVKALAVVGRVSFDHFLSQAELPHLQHLEYTQVPLWPDLGELFRTSSLTARLKSLIAGGFSARTAGAEIDVGAIRAQSFAFAFKGAPLERLSSFDARITSDGLGRILAAPFAGTLKHLDISDNPIAPDAYRAFQQCHPNMRLDKLDVSGTPLAGSSLEPLLSAASLRNLTKLEMNGSGSTQRNMELLANSAFWSQATELRAHSGTIPDSTFEPLARSAGPPALRLLDLADNFLRTEGVRMLCEAPWAGSLTWLALSRNYLDDESCGVLAKSGRFTNLRTLHLAHHNGRQEGSDGERITDDGVFALCRSPSLANLRLLTLSYTSITEHSVYSVLNTPNWKLFGLGVGGCDLASTTAIWLSKSPGLARLTWLDISDNRRLGGSVLRSLAESPYLSPLCELDCGGIAIDDDVRAIFRERLGPRFSH